ncbi:peptide-methionine (S)-S-oxide reductase [Nonlabens xylanidelens]|uniref:Peptide methionine sulfoxide reductase MsrA n=1 Tax=Nonlabens xylanidelens TaxID=191564 RepID=A0A2S6IJM4_9FLAO|nr:peptide-methionine (S)-S-oxide reductase MsrA [Nonlabens xylanidelens]PPK94381.1 peptide-methionine (S)-S-oxide reductase [Nonlabens xylanidelens]PQJ21456.1 peptide-methionine (S)-S-oxide reductase [Nonlabens xylanidelens]
MKIVSILIMMFLASNCNEQDNNASQTAVNTDPIEVPSQEGMERAYFASGCFWCVEEIYEGVIGVSESISGYSGGHTQNPTYEDSNTGKTGHAETNEIIYDPSVVSFKTLVDVYFASQNIEQVNGQGPDHGSQYRSIIFYQNDDQKKIIEDKITSLTQEGFSIGAEVKPFQKFWIAEDYHQDYAKLHPTHGYIRGVSIPRFRKFAQKMPQVIKPEAQH